MIKQNFIIDELEKQRILNLHETATKNLYLIKEENGLLKDDFPSCVQDFGDPTPSGDGKYGGIDGNAKSKSYNWTGYRFFSNFRVKKPDGTMEYYFCKGNQPLLGQKQQATKGGKTSSQGLGGTILKIGSSGDAVKQVQNRIVNGGHGDGQSVGGNANCGKDVNSCDGKYGRGTAEAVKKFQTSAHITSDGVVGDETWQQLFGGTAPEQPSKSSQSAQSNQPSGGRKSTISYQNQRQRGADAFCNGDDPLLIDYPKSKWHKKPFKDYVTANNVTDEEILYSAWVSCPSGAKTKNLATFLKDPSNMQKYEVVGGNTMGSVGAYVAVDIKRK